MLFRSFIAKAHERSADAIILDLEDAVARSEKAAARSKLPDTVKRVGQNGAKVFVRINADLDMIRLDAEAACRAGARVAGLSESTVAAVLALANHGSLTAPDGARLFPEYLAAVEQLAAVVDTWQA